MSSVVQWAHVQSVSHVLLNYSFEVEKAVRIVV